MAPMSSMAAWLAVMAMPGRSNSGQTRLMAIPLTASVSAMNASARISSTCLCDGPGLTCAVAAA